MRPHDVDPDRRLTSAALGALMAARWHALDLMSRRSPQAAPDLLRGLAAELAFAPLVRDQLLAVALNACADKLEEPGDIGDVGVATLLSRLAHDPAQRSALRRGAFESGALPAAESDQVAATAEARLRVECGSPAELAARLREEAALQEQLWDHPQLPADPRTRLVALFSVPKLRARADDVDPCRARKPACPGTDRSGRRVVRNALANLVAKVGGGRPPATGAAASLWWSTGLAFAAASAAALVEA